MEERAGSKTAGYVVCLVLAVPLLLLVLMFVGPAFGGGRPLVVALVVVGVVAAGTGFAWFMRRRADRVVE